MTLANLESIQAQNQISEKEWMDYSRLWQDTLARRERGGYEKPEPEFPTVSDYWTNPQKIGTAWDLIQKKQAPAWMSPDFQNAVGIAHEWYTEQNGTDDWTQWSALPEEDAVNQFMMTFEAPADDTWMAMAPTVSEPAQAYAPITQYSGLTPEQYAALEPWQKTSMSIMGSRPMQGFASVMEWGAEHIPGWDTAMNALDLLARGVKRSAGLIELAQAKGIDLPDILENLPNAWTTAEQAYRATPLQSLLPEGLEQALGVAPTPEAWKFGQVGETQLQPEQYGPEALGEYFRRLNAGETRETLDQEFEQRFGVQGTYRDMAGMMFADPLNFIGAAAAKAAQGALKAGLKGTDVASDAAKMARVTSALQKGGGPIDLAKRFAAVASEVMTQDEVASLPKWIKAITAPFDMPYTKAGDLKLLQLGKTGASGLFSLTPASRTMRWLDVFSKTMPEVMNRFEKSESGLADLRKFLVAAKGGKIDDAAFGSMKILDGADWAAVQMFLKDGSVDKMIKSIDDFLLSKPTRDMWQSVVEATGTKSDDLLKALTGNRAAQNAAEIVAKMGAETGVTEQALIDAAKYFSKATGAINVDQALGKAYANLFTEAGEWGAKWFNVPKDSAYVRWSNLMKAAQGMVLLDLNPTYLLQNLIDNNLKLAREGMALTRYVDMMFPSKAAKMAERIWGKDMMPPRIVAGYGGELGGEAIAAIRKAQAPAKAGIPEKLRGGISKVRGVMPIRAGAEAVESTGRRYGNVVEYLKSWFPMWKEGKGYQKVTSEMSQTLPKGLERFMYDGINNRMTQDELFAFRDELLRGELVKTADMMVDDVLRKNGYDAAHAYAMKDTLLKTGVGAQLEKLQPGMKVNEIGKIFDDIFKEANNAVEEAHKASRKFKFTQAEAIGGKEGVLGATNLLDDAMGLRVNQRLNDIRALEEVWAHRGEDLFYVLYDQYKANTKAEYSILRQKIQDIHDGLVSAFDRDSKFGAFFEGNIDDEFNLWDKFYDTKYKMIDDFFQKQTEQVFDDVGWAKLKDDIGLLYQEKYAESLRLMGERYGKIKELMVANYGDEIAPLLDAWITRVTALEEDMFKRMDAFWQKVKTITNGEMRNAEWEKFIPEWRMMLVNKQAMNTAELRNIQNVANGLEKAGAAPIRANPLPVVKPLTKEQMAQQKALFKIAGQYKISPRYKTKAGYWKTMSDKTFGDRILRTVNKPEYGGKPGEFANVYDIPADVLRARLEARMQSKYLEGFYKAWGLEMPKADSLDEAAVGLPAVDIDPIGVTPVASIKGLSSYPDFGDMKFENLYDDLLPFLTRLQADYANAPMKVDFGVLSPEVQRGLKSYFNDVANGMADTRLASTKYASLATDAAMLDYNRRYGLDTIMDGLIPYQFWFTRSAMNWAISAIDHPAWFAQWHRLREMQDKLSQDQEGFPQRLAGKMQIHIPFMPEGWGNTIYVDPLHQMFGFEGMGSQLMRPLMRDQMNIEGRAEYILQNMERDGQITEEQYRNAINSKGTNTLDPLWTQALSQASQEVDREISSPVDLVSTVLTPSLPIQWALERMGLMSDRGSTPGTYPSISTFQNITSYFTPGGVNLYEKFQDLIGAAQGEGSKNARGFLWDYYVARELSNMAFMGADTDAVKLAMVDKQGDLYKQAVDTVGKQMATRSFASILWADFFPEGEMGQRNLQKQFEQAAEAGKLQEFFDKHPEYEARMLRNNWEDPDAMMKNFAKSEIWDAYYNLSKIERDAWNEQAGDLWTESFMNKDTRNYDNISTDTMVQWLRELKGVIPETAPETPPMNVEFPEQQVVSLYDQYEDMRVGLFPNGDMLEKMYFGLDEKAKPGFLSKFPELQLMWEYNDKIMSENPELIPELIRSKYKDAPENIQQAIVGYYSERSFEFPLITMLNGEYWDLPAGQRKAFLKQNPMLKEYWDWNDAFKVQHPELEPYLWANKNTSEKNVVDVDLSTLIKGYSGMEHALKMVQYGAKMESGTLAVMQQLYERVKPDMSFAEWLRLQGYTY